jgi:hypothetical protein
MKIKIPNMNFLSINMTTKRNINNSFKNSPIILLILKSQIPNNRSLLTLFKGLKPIFIHKLVWTLETADLTQITFILMWGNQMKRCLLFLSYMLCIYKMSKFISIFLMLKNSKTKNLNHLLLN